jgi:predicted unusual protein kinase regulating ubiquinone biosynthesis (AarF/ABC1/UbiB family)
MRTELGGPLGRVFSDFDERAFAAASIGQVHRATTLEGGEVVVKVQYPGVAEAVETDLRNAMLLLPLVKRLAPGLCSGQATRLPFDPIDRVALGTAWVVSSEHRPVCDRRACQV